MKLKRIHGHMIEPGGSFWDLGAGVGKLVIAAAMGHNFEVGSRTLQGCTLVVTSVSSWSKCRGRSSIHNGYARLVQMDSLYAHATSISASLRKLYEVYRYPFFFCATSRGVVVACCATGESKISVHLVKFS